MHRNASEPSEHFLCRKQLQLRAEMMFTGLDWHEEILSIV